MSFFQDPPLHNFPDRAIRRLLEDPRNLRDLLADAVPDLVDGFDFTQVEPVDREFLLEDWRRREADLLFRIPFRQAEDEVPVLVCVLLEHQSAPDPRMPLRLLVYAALYWEGEWKAWENNHEEGEPLKLSAILPLVFYTGERRWRAGRNMADLIAAPEPFQRFAPRWETLFWDLSERTPEALLASAGAWLQALTVVRAEHAATEEFEVLYEAALRRMEATVGEAEVRRQDLLWFMLSWAVLRRPNTERDRLVSIAQAVEAETDRKKEFETMRTMVFKNWQTELLEEGEARGVALGEARAELRTLRENLRLLLEAKFGVLPEGVRGRIDAEEDPARLRAAFQAALHLEALEDLPL